jgi:hypothetical protein
VRHATALDQVSIAWVISIAHAGRHLMSPGPPGMAINARQFVLPMERQTLCNPLIMPSVNGLFIKGLELFGSFEPGYWGE